MGNPVRQVITATGNGTPVSLDWVATPFTVNLQVVLPSGATATYTVQETNDDLNDPTITPIWQNDGVLNGLTVTGQNTLTAPVRWVRCNASALGGSPAQVIFYVTQGMSAR